MKKLIAIVLPLVLTMSLVACTKTEPATNSDNSSSSTQQLSQNEDSQQDVEQNSDESAASEDNNNADVASDAPTGVAAMLPQNFHMQAPSLDLYKIGDDFMNGSSCPDFYRYIGNNQYEIYYWDNDAFVDADATMGLESLLDMTVDCTKDSQKTGATKEICGVTCAEYVDDITGTTYYLYEDAGLLFEVWYDGASKAAYTVTEWDDTITEFPCEPPTK